ncbi:dynamin family protein [Campylobacter curvus]|uniref:dynamin family protein n=1 Tax=Campylobacter curvus TaxID=200 RepID=UPI0014700533|nr:dynamin family protein [Campylobacter curvus]
MDKFLTEIWGGAKLFLDQGVQMIADERDLAILLACNALNYDRFIAISEFRQILHSLGLRADIYSVQTAQIGAINALRSSKISKSKVIRALKRLENENIINEAEFINLEFFLNSISQDSIKADVETKIKRVDVFHEKIDKLNAICERICSLGGSEISISKAKAARQKIEELKFNIVVTGVVNAGKSTLLNALLNAKILGTSNVPETINLSILKFASEPYAKVNFWSKSELKELGIDISSEPTDLAGSSIVIQTNELKNYTSAGSAHAKLVKSVELYENLELLKDNIRIIDTPGIDDAVFLRERLVRDFMSECDLMVHLMNVSQSATQKDVEFIEQSVHGSHIVKLVVVLTHVDLLSNDELNEVTSYTKKRMNERFNSENSDLEVKFFAISAKNYLDGKPNSGVEEFKEYLYETFFGANSEKSRLSLEAYKKELNGVCEELLAQTTQSILNLSGSNLSLNEKFSELNEQEAALKNEFEALSKTAQEQLNRLDVSGLEANFSTGLKMLAQSLQERILREADFAGRNKEKLQTERINYIVQSTLNDGIISLMRQNRNEILSRIKACRSDISLKFQGFLQDKKEEIFSINDYLKLKGIVFETAKVCECAVKSLNLGAKELAAALNASLEEFLGGEKIKNFVFELSRFEKDEFIKEIKDAVQIKEELFKASCERLKNEAALLNSTSEDVSAKLLGLQGLKNDLNAIISELKDV